MIDATPIPLSTPTRAIVLILITMVAFSINDSLIKLLSGGYPLHQIVFVRSIIGLVFTMVLLSAEGGVRLLRTDQPMLHLFRALLIVMANMTFFSALAVLPLGAATALFFVAPLFITLLAVPVLGERVGVHRLAALVVGFAGVGVMMVPSTDWGEAPRAALFLPVAAAACYAGMQVMTRKLGARSAASAMAFYIQGAFIGVSILFWVTVGDGRLAEQVENESLVFLLRAWIWPAPDDIWKFAVLGVISGFIGYGLSQAYRLGQAATIASYEYAALPAAIFMGWLVFGERPSSAMVVGTALIAGSGLYVFARERRRSEAALTPERPIRRG